MPTGKAQVGQQSPGARRWPPVLDPVLSQPYEYSPAVRAWQRRVLPLQVAISPAKAEAAAPHLKVPAVERSRRGLGCVIRGPGYLQIDGHVRE